MIRTLLMFVAVVVAAGAVRAGTVDPSYRGYVKTVSIRSEKDGKETNKRMKIRTQQYNKSYSSTIEVHVEVTDGAGKRYFGTVEGRQNRMRVDNWSQAEWLVDVKCGALAKAEVTGYVVRHVATEQKDILDEKTDGVKTLDELKERNASSEPLELKFVSYELLGM